ncbi:MULTISPECIES: adenosylcobinamide-GDP ribazoletransferase [Cetobacterium]|jgi:adenosylcobinamide-GDP ribazoletransferase|uniref:Adenosylcobinamide-GDP ribazoletransferase n=1 Tax=Candidatus Cetobacterium colombiensis TaxID=3073100 RepID=A0ABU4W990_9FUSO|nr:adenosylcobinamide-GDP ribazoletransferase [Candidatus Cetobacterium colombiensis]MDX8335720.1 adenosylcobinamide-GDP ribazoletransferase [Candidatus Cetobacterium colombiensis]
MKGLALLFKFMTRLPFPGGNKFDSKALGKSMKWFPIVGLVIGLINILVSMILETFIPSPILIGIILVTLDVIITGGLHLDGLADTFDGIFSYRSKQKMLEIMKDSRVGTNGVLVLILYFIFKIAFLVETSELFGINQGVLMLIVPILARINGVINCACEPYARSTGMGKTFVDNTQKSDLFISYVLITAILFGIAKYFMLPFASLFIVLNILAISGFFFGKLMTRKIGGITGDTLGALLELSSVLSLVLMYLFL